MLHSRVLKSDHLSADQQGNTYCTGELEKCYAASQ